MSNYFSGFVSGAIVFAIVAFCLGVKYQQSVMISQLRGYCGYRAFYVNNILTIEKIESEVGK